MNLELRGEALHMRLTVENPAQPPECRPAPGWSVILEENTWYIDAMFGREAVT